ncbi:MAG: polysaccharide deacetylase, partial [Candidatus Delongbacteria bacterium]|nr:polysaccharide deacetylase [Candidatus Delongbacteria bacterium]
MIFLSKNIKFYTFSEFINNHNSINEFVIIRHDVDRKPKNALKMAELENELGIRSTYYFRHKKHTFFPKIIKQIQSLG